MEINPKIIEELMKAMVKHKIDQIILPELTLTKGIHDPSPSKRKRNKKEDEPLPALVYNDIPDEVLFKSSSAPAITLSDLSSFISE